MDVVTERDIMQAIERERERQDVKWGEQNHKDGTGSSYQPPFDLKQPWKYSHLTIMLKRRVDRLQAEGHPLWSLILLEEVFEALSAETEEDLYDELVQTAAVIVQWLAALQRRRDARDGL